MQLTDYLRNNRYKIFKTFLTYVICTGLGAASTLIGSSLLDIQIRVQQSFEVTSRLVPIRSVGYILGALTSGILEKIANDNLVICLSTFLAGISLIAAPWSYQLTYIAAFIFVSGVAQGLNDTYCNLTILKIWGKDCTNWLHVLYMSFGVGALLTPVFTRPFLLPSLSEGDGGLDVTQANETLISGYSPEDVMVQYAYLILGSPLCIVAIPFFFCYLKERNKGTVEMGEETGEVYADIGWLRKYTAIGLMAIVSNLAFGAEVLVGTLGPAFAVKSDLSMDKQTAVLLVTVFWSTFSFYRLIFIPLTTVFKEERLILFNILFLLVGVVVLVPHAAFNQMYAWISFTLLGMGYSPLFGSVYGSLLNYFKITGNIASFIIVCGILGESMHASILAPFMEESPVIFVYYLGAMSLLLAIVCFITPLYCKKMLPKSRVPRRNTLSYSYSR